MLVSLRRSYVQLITSGAQLLLLAVLPCAHGDNQRVRLALLAEQAARDP